MNGRGSFMAAEESGEEKLVGEEEIKEVKRIRKKLRQIEKLERLNRNLNDDEENKVRINKND